jgi:hypothetical protein
MASLSKIHFNNLFCHLHETSNLNFTLVTTVGGHLPRRADIVVKFQINYRLYLSFNIHKIKEHITQLSTSDSL